MKVNGYEIGQEPTREEFAAYRKVHLFMVRENVAQFIGGPEHDGYLSADEFERLCRRFEKLDFSGEEWEALKWEYDEIIEERSQS